MKGQGLMTDLSTASSPAVLLAYGFSKFFSAVVSDRPTPAIMPLGLALSA